MAVTRRNYDLVERLLILVGRAAAAKVRYAERHQWFVIDDGAGSPGIAIYPIPKARLIQGDRVLASSLTLRDARVIVAAFHAGKIHPPQQRPLVSKAQVMAACEAFRNSADSDWPGTLHMGRALKALGFRVEGID